jgi:hypothetical protein
LSAREIIARDQGIANRRKRILDWVRACQSPPPVTDLRSDLVSYKLHCPFHRSVRPTAVFTVRDEFDAWPDYRCTRCLAGIDEFIRHVESLSSMETTE